MCLAGCTSSAGSGGWGGSPADRHTGQAKSAVSSATPVLTHHNDSARTGQNLAETTLTWASVKSQFGRLYTLAVDDNVYAQPLYVPNLTIGGGVHNALYVATESNSIYVFDADTGSQLAHWAFGSPVPSVAVLPDTCRNISPDIGITGTPVIDAASSTLYFVTTNVVSGGGSAQSLNAIDLASGAHKFGSPRSIGASVAGDGPESVNGVIRFDPARSLQRAGLLLQGGYVYVAWGAYCDDAIHLPDPWFHGWVMGFAAQSLTTAPLVLNTTPHADASGPPCSTECNAVCAGVAQCPSADACAPEPYGASIWQGGGGLASDGTFLYANTGNGTFDPAHGDYGDSTLAVRLSNLTVSSWFTPYDQALLSVDDWDLGAGGVVLLDGVNAQHPHLLVSAGKTGTIYLLDRDALGSPPGPLTTTVTNTSYCGVDAGADRVVAEDRCAVGLPSTLSSSNTRDSAYFGVPAYFNGSLYFGGHCDILNRFAVGNTTPALGSLPVTSSPLPAITSGKVSNPPYPYPGVIPSVSASGASDAIVWVARRAHNPQSCPAFFATDTATGKSVQVLNSQHPTVSALLAYRADTLEVLYDSSQGAPSDGPGAVVQFTTPTIAGGKVFVGGKQTVTVYGLSPHPTCSTSSCPSGCCQNGACVTAPGNAACGASGAACIACQPNETCSGGACQPTSCSASSPCPSGCCQNGACVTPSVCACGSNGSVCVSCASGATCIGGVCQPPAYQGFLDLVDCTTAAGWGWDANRIDTPIPVDVYVDKIIRASPFANLFRQDLLNAGIGNGYHAFSFPLPSDVTDGKLHSVEVRFPGSLTNLSLSPKSITCGTTACGASTCPNGCCQNGACVTPSNSACGTGGATCSTCLAGSPCIAGVCQAPPACSASACPNGCCQNGACVTPSNAACGTGGALCKACPGGFTCTGGVCKGASLCNASTCPIGCCQSGTCTTPTSAACGSSGSACVACAAGQTCSGGACQAAACNASTCPSGCCQSGACVTPTSAACGSNGSACVACAAGQTCTGGACAACGVCVPGATQTVACGNCGTRTDTCNGSCQWTQGTCTGEGVCSPGAEQSCCSGCSQGCGCAGTMTCQSSCTWGSCAGSVCKPGVCR